MRLLTIQDAAVRSDELPPSAVVCHDVRNPAQRSEILARKGSALSREEIVSFLSRGVHDIHLAVADPDDLSENEAAERLAAAIIGPGVRTTEAHNGEVSFVSSRRGMLRVDAAQLDRVNAHDGVLLLTSEADRPVEAGAPLGVFKCAPLFLPSATVAAIEALGSAGGPMLRVEAFQPRRLGLLAPRERLRGGAFERAQSALTQAIEWYGSRLEHVIGADASVDALAAAYADLRRTGADLILAAGASATDPLDIVFEGLRHAGGEVEQIGMPVEPGTACWIGRLDGTPVLGLASCELFGQPGALDLLLPRVLAGEPLDRQLLRRLASGGLLHGPSRVAPYHSANDGPP